MLKGLILAASGTERLKRRLTKEKLPYVELAEGERAQKEAYESALRKLSAEKKEVLCLVERDQEEVLARDLGLFCLGCVRKDLPKEALWGCCLLLEGDQEVDRDFLENVHTRALGLPVRIAETERLLIREMTLEDLDDINGLYREEDFLFPETRPVLGRKEEEEKIKAYISYMYGMYQFGMWVVIEKESGKLIGRAGLGIADYLGFSEVDLGYLTGKEYRRKGYGEEAARAVLDYASRILELPGLSAYIDRGNKASLGLIEKLGFRREKEFVCKEAGEERPMYRYYMEFARPLSSTSP